MSPFAERNHPLAQLVAELRKDRRVSDEWRARHEAAMGTLWSECAEPGVLLDLLFLDADRSTWIAATNAALDEARSTPEPDAVGALRAVCDAVRVLVATPPSIECLVGHAQQRSARELEAMGYPL